MAELEEGSQVSDSGEPTDTGVAEGNPHFSVSDGPPGGTTESTLDSQSDADTAASEGQAVLSTPAAPFFEFQTATGERKSFATKDEANQFFSSWNGRLSKAERELKEAERLNLEWQDAYNSGQLHEYYAKQNVQKVKPAQTETKVDPGNPVEALLSKIDRKYVTELLKKGDAVKAMEYLSYVNGLHFQEQLEAHRKELADTLDSIIAPTRFQHQVQNSLQYIAESEFQSVNDVGEARYPEFQSGPNYDQGLVKHFRKVWLDMPVEEACTPRGFRLAYYEAKATYQRPESANQAGGASSAKAAEMVRDASGRFIARQTALAMSSEGSKAKPAVGAPAKGGNDILAAMRGAAKPVNPHFSVSPE